MPWFNSKNDEERRRKTDKAIEDSRATSKKAKDSRDRVLKSLIDIEEMIKNDRLQRGSNS